ncbi:hypothetical protein GFM18_30160 [Rhizobium laguerreae]|nr:hypothetical protein [Rhizobium laguerreae]
MKISITPEAVSKCDRIKAGLVDGQRLEKMQTTSSRPESVGETRLRESPDSWKWGRGHASRHAGGRLFGGQRDGPLRGAFVGDRGLAARQRIAPPAGLQRFPRVITPVRGRVSCHPRR